MAVESRYIKLSPKLKIVVELDDLFGSLRVEILSQMLTPITWWFSSTGASDFSSVLSVQARKLRKIINPRQKVIFLCILKKRYVTILFKSSKIQGINNATSIQNKDERRDK